MKWKIVGLAALFAVAGSAFVVSMTGTDKAERAAVADAVLAMKKAMLGSTGMEVTPVGEPKAPGQPPVEADRAGDAPVECLSCTDGEGYLELVDTVMPGKSKVHHLPFCDHQVVKLDVVSERAGAPTDLALTVTDESGSVLLQADDGRGFSGTSVDPCLIFACPAEGLYTVQVSNLVDPASRRREAESGYILRVSVLCNLETEPNGWDKPGDLNCDGGPVVTDDTDEDEDGDIAASGDDEDEGADVTGNAWPVAHALGAAGASEVSARGSVVGVYGGDEQDVDCFSVCLAPGEVLTVDVDSAECDNIADFNQVDPILILEDPWGNPVAADDDTESLDPDLIFKAPDYGNGSDRYKLCLAARDLISPGVYELAWEIRPRIDSGGEDVPPEAP